MLIVFYKKRVLEILLLVILFLNKLGLAKQIFVEYYAGQKFVCKSNQIKRCVTDIAAAT